MADVSCPLPGNRGWVVKGLTLGLHAGGRVAILGPSGCGKTTLCRALAGLTRLQGTVSMPPRARVAFVPQQPLLAPALTLQAQLQYPDPAGSDSGGAQWDTASMHRALQDVGLGGLVDRAGGLDRQAPWLGT